jgi:hypothetical protein
MEDKDVIVGLATELVIMTKEARRLASEVKKANDLFKLYDDKVASLEAQLKTFQGNAAVDSTPAELTTMR